MFDSIERIKMNVKTNNSDSEKTSGQLISALAFESLYLTNFLQLKAFLARNGCNARSLDDLTQEVFLRAWAGRGRFSGKSSFRTWLFAIARNVSLEHWRRSGVEEPTDDKHSTIVDEQPFMYSDELEKIRAAVLQLPYKQRIAIISVYFDGMRPTEAAKKLCCDCNTFHRRVTDGHKRLRKLLRRSG